MQKALVFGALAGLLPAQCTFHFVLWSLLGFPVLLTSPLGASTMMSHEPTSDTRQSPFQLHLPSTGFDSSWEEHVVPRRTATYTISSSFLYLSLQELSRHFFPPQEAHNLNPPMSVLMLRVLQTWSLALLHITVPPLYFSFYQVQFMLQALSLTLKFF